MGYRELIKRYIRFLELELGDNFIEAIPKARESGLSERDVGELRTLAGEIFREQSGDRPSANIANYNYRLRLLMNRYGLSAQHAADLAGATVVSVRRWRTSPKSTNYLAMSGSEFDRFEQSLLQWLEGEELARTQSAG